MNHRSIPITVLVLAASMTLIACEEAYIRHEVTRSAEGEDPSLVAYGCIMLDSSSGAGSGHHEYRVDYIYEGGDVRIVYQVPLEPKQGEEIVEHDSELMKVAEIYLDADELDAGTPAHAEFQTVDGVQFETRAWGVESCD